MAISWTDAAAFLATISAAIAAAMAMPARDKATIISISIVPAARLLPGMAQ